MIILHKNNKNGNEASTSRYGSIISKLQCSKVELLQNNNYTENLPIAEVSTVVSLCGLRRLSRVDTFCNSHKVPFHKIGHKYMWKRYSKRRYCLLLCKKCFSAGNKFKLKSLPSCPKPSSSWLTASNTIMTLHIDPAIRNHFPSSLIS